jgi:hypothetical protein
MAALLALLFISACGKKSPNRESIAERLGVEFGRKAKERYSELTGGIHLGDKSSSITKKLSVNTNITIASSGGLPINTIESRPYIVLYSFANDEVRSISLVGPSSYDFKPDPRIIPEAVINDVDALRGILEKILARPADVLFQAPNGRASISNNVRDHLIARWARPNEVPITLFVAVADDGRSCHVRATIGDSEAHSEGSKSHLQHTIHRMAGPLVTKPKSENNVSRRGPANEVANVPVVILTGLYLSEAHNSSVLRRDTGSIIVEFGDRVLSDEYEKSEHSACFVEHPTSLPQVGPNSNMLIEMFVGSEDGESTTFVRTGYGAVVTNALAQGGVQTCPALINGEFHFEHADASDYRLDYHYYWETNAIARHDTVLTENGAPLTHLDYCALRKDYILGTVPKGLSTNRLFHVVHSGKLQYNEEQKEFVLQDAEVTECNERKTTSEIWCN